MNVDRDDEIVVFLFQTTGFYFVAVHDSFPCFRTAISDVFT